MMIFANFLKLFRKKPPIEKFQINYGIVVIDNNTQNIIQFVGYREPPNGYDMDMLRHELATDPGFKWVNTYDWRLAVASPEMVKYFQRALKGGQIADESQNR